MDFNGRWLISAEPSSVDGRGELVLNRQRARWRRGKGAIHVQTLYVKCVTVICNYMCQTYNARKLKTSGSLCLGICDFLLCH